MSTAGGGQWQPSWPPPPAQRSRRDFLAGAGVAVVLLPILALNFWWRYQTVVAADRRSRATSTTVGMAPTHPFKDTVWPQTLPAGACLDRAPVTYVRTVPCDQPHVAEIVSLIPYAGPVADYPSLLNVLDQTLDRCQADFNAYVGASPDRSPASPFVAGPDRYDWNLGERQVVCFATARNGGNLAGSLRGGGGSAVANR